MRPRQWTKNGFVFAGLLFTLDAHHSLSDFAKVTAAFILFSLLSGSIYIINDIADAQNDRFHPRKCLRPIASGALSKSAASIAAVILICAGLVSSIFLGRWFALSALAYVAMMAAYSFVLKRIVLLDVMTISAGFLLRAVAGAACIGVTISSWLLICTILMTLFIALAKRRDELVSLQGVAGNHRASLSDYSIPFLDQLVNITASATIMAYALYTFFSRTGTLHPYMMVTLPFVIYGIFRYLFLIHRGDGAGSPEVLLLKDKPLLIDLLLWILVCGIIVKLS
jgi:4-hydroxybenzoate polyprenyltransferase